MKSSYKIKKNRYLMKPKKNLLFDKTLLKSRKKVLPNVNQKENTAQ